MESRYLVSWNAIIAGYMANGYWLKVLDLFQELISGKMFRPNSVTLVNVLFACAHLKDLIVRKVIHKYILCIWSAQKLFQSTLVKEYLLVFTSMIDGYAIHSMGEETLCLFSYMLELGLKPDHVIITTILSSCSYVGVVDESDAYSLVTGMSVEANANVWGTLLGASRTHHEVELRRVVVDHLFQVKANNIENYVVMSNLYAADARWDGVMEDILKLSNPLKPQVNLVLVVEVDVPRLQ
ncbi:hypothetical protein CRYUN_Cryun17cG0061000 [Craigia yunnanensis]